MLQSALVSNVFLVSQLLYSKFPSNFIIRLLGIWGVPTVNGKLLQSNQKVAIGGLAYYLQPPLNSTDALTNPIKTFIYIAFVLGICAVFSVTWTEISGTSAKDVTKQFKQQGMVITGQRETSVGKTMKKIIPTAAILGGVSIGALSVGSDLLGTLGSGSNILMASTTVYGFYEKAVKEGGLSKNKIVNGFSELM
jgi:protein transport protein SEC61 subunit alpha